MDAIRVKTPQSKQNVVLSFDWLKDENKKTIERAYNLARLAAMCDLESGWDGDAGHPISRDLIAFVGGVLLRVGLQPEVYPTSEGGIQIQYEKPDKTYLEVVFSPDVITGMKVDKGNYESAVFTDFMYTSEKAVSDYIGEFNES